MISKGVYGGDVCIRRKFWGWGRGCALSDQSIFFSERGGGGVIGNQNRKLRTDKTV